MVTIRHSGQLLTGAHEWPQIRSGSVAFDTIETLELLGVNRLGVGLQQKSLMRPFMMASS